MRCIQIAPFVSRLLSCTALFVAASGLPLEAQIARAPVDLHPGIAGVGSRLSIDSDADLTAAVWVDEIQLEVYCSVSDGRGVEWSAPLRVDTAPHSGGAFPLTFIDSSAVAVSGENIYVTWRELDLGTGFGQVLFARSTNGGASFSSETILDDGIAGGAKSPRAIMAVSPDPAGDHIYVLRLDSNAQFGPLEPRVVASHNSGLSFGSAVPITTLPASAFPAREPSIVADGFEAHVVWADDPNAPDSFEVYYQQSLDGGLTWLDIDVLISRGMDQLGLESEARFFARGDRFFVTYVATSPVTGSDELRYSLSLDRGANWTKGAVAFTPPSGTDIEGPAAHISQAGNLVTAWEDDRTGAPEVYTATFPVNGSGFSSPVSLWSESGLGGAEARIESPGDASGPDTVLIAWDGGGGITTGSGGFVPAALSMDGGLNFGTPVELDIRGDADADYVELAYDDRYDNYLAIWRSEATGIEDVRSGGLRPQTLEPIGAVSGGTAQFEFSGFTPSTGGVKFAWALASDTPGNFPLPLMDGRDVGLAFDATLLATLSSPSVFSAMLDSTGAGSTPSFSIPSPTGTVFYGAAVSIALGPVTLTEITDVIPIVIQ